VGWWEVRGLKAWLPGAGGEVGGGGEGWRCGCGCGCGKVRGDGVMG